MQYWLVMKRKKCMHFGNMIIMDANASLEWCFVFIVLILLYPLMSLAVSTSLPQPTSITEGAITNTTVSVSWSQVVNATGYYVSYQRQDLGAPPVVTPQYERLEGVDNTSVTLSGLEPGTTYSIRVWSTDGYSVNNGPTKMNVTTSGNGKCCVHACDYFKIPNSMYPLYIVLHS